MFNSPHGPGSTPGGARAIRRGWFDAGDYGPYVTNAAPVWFAIGAAMDLAPGFVLLTFDGNRLSARNVRSDGAITDRFQLLKSPTAPREPASRD